MEIIFLLCLGIAVGLFVASIVVAMSVSGIVDWYSQNRGRLPDWCFFCVAFWLSVIVTIIYFVTGYESFKWIYIASPFISSAVAHKFMYHD